MQKISSYLYPNRINVVADLAPYQTEWRIVYQRVIKIYKGLTNVVEFDFKNAQQRRIDISSYNIQCIITEMTGLAIAILDLAPSSITGIATLTFPNEVFDHLEPQFLKYSLVVVDEAGRRLPVYADTAFSTVGTLELLGGVFEELPKPQELTNYNYKVDDSVSNVIKKIYYSDAVIIKPENDISDNTTVALDFVFDGLAASVEVQSSESDVVSTATIWKKVDEFSVTPATTFLTKTYYELTDYTNKTTWLRIQYTPASQNTGKLAKVILRFNSEPYTTVISGGSSIVVYNSSDLDINGGNASTIYTTDDTIINDGTA